MYSGIPEGCSPWNTDDVYSYGFDSIGMIRCFYKPRNSVQHITHACKKLLQHNGCRSCFMYLFRLQIPLDYAPARAAT